MMIPLFSVIIPTFNSASYISNTLDSLKRQTFVNFEVIIVDDYSSDYCELMTVVDGFKGDINIQLFKHTKNRNGAAARNTGVDKAIGVYVAFLDADDRWAPERLQTISNYISASKISVNTILYGRVKLFRGEEYMEDLPPIAYKNGQSISEYIFCYKGMMQTSTFVCQRKLFESVRFDERFSRHQDSTFILEAAKYGCSFEFIDEALVEYRVPQNVLKKRVAGLRVTPSFCIRWMEIMSPYMTKKAVSGYRFYVYSRVLFVSNKKLKGVLVALNALFGFDAKMIYILFKEAKTRFKHRLYSIFFS